MRLPAKYLKMGLLLLATLLATEVVQAQEAAPDETVANEAQTVERPVTDAPASSPEVTSSGSLLELDRAMIYEQRGEADRSIALRQSVYWSQLTRIQAMPSDAPERTELIRDFVDNAYQLAWFRIDQDDMPAARAIESKLKALVQPLDLPTARQEWALPLVQWHWLRSAVYEGFGQGEIERHSRHRAFELTQERETYSEDYSQLSRIRLTILQFTRNNEADLNEYCSLAHQLNTESLGEFRGQVFSCRFSQALYMRDRNDLSSAMQVFSDLLYEIRQSYEDGNRRTYFILIPKILAEQSYISENQGDNELSVNLITQAAEEFSYLLNNYSITQSYSNEIKNTYLNFSFLNLQRSARFRDRLVRSRETVRIFTDLANALERTLLTYPRSASIAFVAADARQKVADALIELGQLDDAQSNITSALQLAEGHSVLVGERPFTEDASAQCRLFATNVRIAYARRDADTAFAAYSTLEEHCGSWLRRYPWDVFTKDAMAAAALQAGTLLSESRRFDDALPLLTFASDWGWSDASFELAQIYRDQDFSGYDLDRARQIHTLSLRQGVYVVNLTANSGTAQNTYSFILRQYGAVERCPIQNEPLPPHLVCAGFVGIRDMAHWIQIARGYTVNSALVSALDTIALQANEGGSFPYLVERLLSSSESQDTPNDQQNLKLFMAQIISYPSNSQDIMDIKLGRIISRISSSNCAGWIIYFNQRPGTADLSIDYVLPDTPSQPHDVGSGFTVSSDGRVISATRRINTEGGFDMYMPLCLTPGDPLGTYRFIIRQNGEELANLAFEVVE